jgi:hypothetical protein
MYIDPNAGGVLFQCLACLFSIAILAVIVGAVVFFAKKGTSKPEERKMNQAPIQQDPIELDREDCIKIIDLLEKHGKNKGANWEAWAGQINQIFQSNLDKLPDAPKVVVSLEKANWKAIQDIIQKTSEELGGEWLEWFQKFSQMIDALYPKVETPPPPRVMPPASVNPTNVNPTNAKPGCPNCRSFNTVRHKTYLIGWGWGKIVIGLFLAEIFIGVIPFYWGVIDLIRAKKIPSKNEWLCKNCKYTWVQE